MVGGKVGASKRDKMDVGRGMRRGREEGRSEGGRAERVVLLLLFICFHTQHNQS